MIILFLLLFIFLLHFRFWGTCAEHAIQLHRYTYGSVFSLLSPLHPHLAFLPRQSLPSSPPLSLPIPPNRPQCVSTLPCVHVFSLFITRLWMRRCGISFSVLVWVCWGWRSPDSSMSLETTQTHHFWLLHNIPWCICATFFQSSLFSMGIWVDSRSLLW